MVSLRTPDETPANPYFTKFDTGQIGPYVILLSTFLPFPDPVSEAAVFKATRAKLQAFKRDIFDEFAESLPANKAGLITEVINPILAKLRAAILSAYNPETDQLNSSAIGVAMKKALDEIQATSNQGIIPEDAFGGVVAVETAMALYEELPKKGRSKAI